MSHKEKLIFKLQNQKYDSKIRFSELQYVLKLLGFSYRVKGDHFIYWKDGLEEIINIQPDGNMAKPYQVKQIRNLLRKYYMEV